MEVVLKHLGYLLVLFSFFPLIPVVAALIYGESMLPFFAPILLSLAFGWWLMRRYGKKEISINSFDLPRSITFSALSFILLSLLGLVPYVLELKLGFLDALFESVSGFTTTGLSVFTDVESLPRSLLLWRAETQWIGGIGIIVVFLLIVSAMRQQESPKETTTKAKVIATLYQAQGASEKLEANTRKSIRNTIIIYCVYTILGISLLYFVGLTLFEAVSISFTSIATGGFAVTNAFYTSWPVLLVVMLVMLLGSVSFVLHNRLFRGKVREFVTNGTVRFFLLLIAFFTLVAFVFMKDFKDALFTVVTAITTTGFATVDFNTLPHVALLVVMVCMIVGGMIASTAGGIKVGRFRMMLKSIPWLVKKAVSPAEAIIPLKVDGKVVDDDNILVVHAFITIYLLALFLGTAVLMVTGLSFLDSSFQVTSALGTVGLSTTDVALFHPVAKIVLILAMLLGRLEIFPILALGKFFYDAARDRFRRREEAGRKLFYIPGLPSEIWKRKS